MGRDLALAAQKRRMSPAGGPAKVLPWSSLRLGGTRQTWQLLGLAELAQQKHCRLDRVFAQYFTSSVLLFLGRDSAWS